MSQARPIQPLVTSEAEAKRAEQLIAQARKSIAQFQRLTTDTPALRARVTAPIHEIVRQLAESLAQWHADYPTRQADTAAKT